MKIQLLTARTSATFSHTPNQIITIPDDEGQRLIDSLQAILAPPETSDSDTEKQKLPATDKQKADKIKSKPENNSNKDLGT